MSRSINADEAWNQLKVVYPDRTWFGGTHLAENKPRLRLMMRDAMRLHPAARDVRVVDVGCFNGFLPFLFA